MTEGYYANIDSPFAENMLHCNRIVLMVSNNVFAYRVIV